jgi:hypothetical protein
MNNDKRVKILLDADVLIHFVKGGRMSLLTELFPNRMVLLDRVEEELVKHNNLVNTEVTNMIRFGYLDVIAFPSRDMKVVSEYAQLIKTKGKGESACLAFCRHHPHIIASSNLLDIQSYCQTHALAYLTTMDILCIGLERKAITEAEANAFIQKVRAAGSKLPNVTIVQYRDSRFDRTKYLY